MEKLDIRKVDSNVLTRWVEKRIEDVGYDIDYVVNSPDSIEKIIVEMKPSNLKMVTNFLYVINNYAKKIKKKQTCDLISSIDRKNLWKKCKKINKKKSFISNEEFKDLIFNIETMEELNSNYYSSLLRCIYYGVYCGDMSVIKNLRGSNVDVSTGNLSVHDDDKKEYSVKIPISLAQDLRELSDDNTWERKNRYGIFEIKIEGVYPDSCFKIENRNDGNNYRYSYFSRIRKISNDYLEHSLKPYNLYISGIMNRIQKTLNKDGYTLEYAFVEHPRLSYPIIQEELNNSNCDMDVKYFRQAVFGNLEEFI